MREGSFAELIFLILLFRLLNKPNQKSLMRWQRY